jgi:predicted secreted protein
MAGTAGYIAVISVGSVVIGKAQDVTASFNKTLAEASTRDGEGWRGKCPALKDVSISADQLWVANDAGLQAITSAWFNDTLVNVALADENSGTGWSFKGFIGTLEKGEPLDDVQTLSFTIESDGKVTPTGTIS